MSEKKLLRVILAWCLALAICLAPVTALAANYVWQPRVGGMIGTQINCLAFGPGSALFAGTNSAGVYRSGDGGQTWQNVLAAPGQGGTMCVLSFLWDGATLYAGTNYGLYVSNDGIAWAQMPSSPNQIASLLIEGQYMYAGVEREGIFRSSDLGRNWTKLQNSITSVNTVSLLSHNNTIYAGTTSGLYKSDDYGQNWIQVLDIPSNTPVYVLLESNGMLYAGTSGGIYTYDGTGWSKENIGITVSLIAHGGALYAGIIGGGVKYRIDPNPAWDDHSAGLLSDNSAYALLTDGTNLYAGTESGVYISTLADVSSGGSWTFSSDGIEGQDVLSLAEHNGWLYAGTRGRGLFKSADGGYNWAAVGPGIVEADIHIRSLASTGAALFAGTPKNLYISTDDGASWAKDSYFNGQVIYSLYYDGRTLYAGQNGRISASTNNGTNWNDYATTNKDVLSFLGFKGEVYAGANNELYKTSSGAFLASALSSLPNDINCLATDGENMYAGTKEAGVYKSTDGGNSWALVGFNGSSVLSLLYYGGELYAGVTPPGGSNSGPYGIYVSADGGQSWQARQDGLGRADVSALIKYGNTIYAGTSIGVYALKREDDFDIYATTRRSITDKPTGVTVSGDNISPYARLSVTPSLLHLAGTCEACDEIRARQAAGDVLALYDIFLSGYHKGAYDVFIPFSGNDGIYTVLHCNKGTLEKRSAPYENGGVTTTWAKLSPFAVVKGADIAVPETVVVDPPKTGDAGNIWGIVMVLVGLCGMAVLRKIRKSKTAV